MKKLLFLLLIAATAMIVSSSLCASYNKSSKDDAMSDLDLTAGIMVYNAYCSDSIVFIAGRRSSEHEAEHVSSGRFNSYAGYWHRVIQNNGCQSASKFWTAVGAI